MRKLFIDIETTPNIVYAWGIRQQFIAPTQIAEPTRLLCAAYAVDDEPIEFVSEWGGGRRRMIRTLHRELNAADAVVHFNGASFDVPHMHREFLEIDLGPTAPFTQIDIYKTVKRNFRFPSHKLAYLDEVLELGDDGKLHVGMDLWVRVLDGDAEARAEMEAYNRGDVDVLRDFYKRLRPWIANHPNEGLHADDDLERCTACGSDNVIRQGFAYTTAGRWQRWRCNDCGRWLRGSRRIDTTPLREANVN